MSMKTSTAASWAMRTAAHSTGFANIETPRHQGRAHRCWLPAGHQRLLLPIGAVAPRTEPARRTHRSVGRRVGKVEAGGIDGAVRVQVSNPFARTLSYAWSTPLAQKRGTLAAGERLVVDDTPPTVYVGLGACTGWTPERGHRWRGARVYWAG